MIESLPPTSIAGHQPSGLGSPDHPMRVMTRRIAGLEPGGWDRETSRVVVSLFDDLASEWHTRTSPQRTGVVRDAIDRGLETLLTGNALAVEVGSGIGTYSSLLSQHFAEVVSVELSWEMLSRAPAEAHRLQGDGAHLPIRDGAADSVILINAFLFPTELDRVLSPGGVLLWVNSSGEETPIHLSTEEIETALPFPVQGVESRAGAGTWCALRRSGSANDTSVRIHESPRPLDPHRTVLEQPGRHQEEAAEANGVRDEGEEDG